MLVLPLMWVLAATPAAAADTPPAPAPSADLTAPGSPSPKAAEVADPALTPPPSIPPLFDDSVDTEPSLGWTLVRTLIVLGIVILTAYVTLNWGLRKLLGIRPASMGGAVVNVVERVPLDQRHSLFVIKAAGEYLLVGSADQSLGLLSKLDTAEVEKIQAAQRASPGLTLSPFLQKLLSKKGK